MSAPRLPAWVKVDLPGRGRFAETRQQLKSLKLTTVCEEARCPNLAECWGSGTATFMILGEVCTRACRFCQVTSGHPPLGPSDDEGARVAEAVAKLGLRYVVITSVDRDDLSDGGASHFVRVVGELRAHQPDLVLELLTPDFQGDERAIDRVAQSGADVLGHNLETVRRLTRSLRDVRCNYDLSLSVLRRYRQQAPRALAKTSLLLGLGETEAEILAALEDARAAGVDWIAMGQYLRPSRKHAKVIEYLHPDRFEQLAGAARALGFAIVVAGPLVRSSYRASEAAAEELLAKRRATLT
jgi:lipoic acid synthetase